MDCVVGEFDSPSIYTMYIVYDIYSKQFKAKQIDRQQKRGEESLSQHYKK